MYLLYTSLVYNHNQGLTYALAVSLKKLVKIKNV